MVASSSSDSDNEENNRLRSVAIDSSTVVMGASCTRKLQTKLDCDHDTSDTLKFYQTRARGLLQEYLDRTYGLEVIENNGSVEQTVACSMGTEDDAGFRLFRCAPPGVSFKCSVKEVAPREQERELQDNDCDESSKTFKSRLLAAAIDGATVKARAEKAISKSICSWLSNEAAEQEAQRIEEERVALLKQQRGEEWLPSVARKMAMDRLSDDGSGVCSKGMGLQKLSNIWRSEDEVRLLFQAQNVGQSETATKNDCGKRKELKKQNKKKEKKAVIE